MLTALGSRLLPIGFGQVMIWEATMVTIPLGFHSAGTARLVVAAVAALVIATTSVRFAGRHLFGWTFTWISYRLLRHGDQHLAGDPLLALAHDFRLRQHVDRAGNRFGLVGVGDGWTAVIRVSGEPPIGTLLGALRAACENTEIPLSAAQLCIRTRAAERVPLLAVRYRPSQAPFAALLRGAGEDGELRATARAALALMATIAKAGHHSMLLDLGELAIELRTCLGGHTRGSAVSDHWRSWSAGGTTQACFVPLGSGDPESAFAATAAPTAAPTTAPTTALVATSYTLWRTGSGKLREDLTIRLVKDEGDGHAPRARDVGVPVVPLYGRQAAGVRRTLPLALSG